MQVKVRLYGDAAPQPPRASKSHNRCGWCIDCGAWTGWPTGASRGAFNKPKRPDEVGPGATMGPEPGMAVITGTDAAKRRTGRRRSSLTTRQVISVGIPVEAPFRKGKRDPPQSPGPA